MNLIFIYGPPAVGKYTVAKALARQTGYKLFHNHVTIDMVESVFEYGTPAFIEAVDGYRLDLIERAAKAGVKGLIFTLVYVKGEDDAYVKKIIRVVHRYKGSVYFVRLAADARTLAARVKHASRGEFNKIRSVEKLNWILRNRPVRSNVPFRPNMTINTVKHSATETASLIIKVFFCRNKRNGQSAVRRDNDHTLTM